MFELIEVKYREVVDIPHLYIAEGLTVVLGASGSGKTTVLRLLNKMISPTQGRIFFNGIDIKQIHSVEHRRNVMMLSQNPAMFEGTIRNNLTVAFKFQEKELPVEKDKKKNQIIKKRVLKQKDRHRQITTSCPLSQSN